MEPIRLLNLAKYAKVFLIITTAISITAAAGLTAAFYKSVNCTTFLIQHKPATILISIINLYVLLIRQQQSEGIVAALQNIVFFFLIIYTKSLWMHEVLLLLVLYHLY